MEKVNLDQIIENIKAKDYFYFTDNFVVFSKYSTISKEDIQRARSFNLIDLYTKGESVEINKTKLLKRKPDEKVLIKRKERILVDNEKKGIYEGLLSLIYKIFILVKNDSKIDVYRIYNIASLILDYASKNTEDTLLEISKGRDTSRLESHAANVGILSALTAISLKITGDDLLSIVSGALMHDIGILMINNNNNLKEIQRHTVYGYNYLKSIKTSDDLFTFPSIQHHEKAKGIGYPNKITLSKMNISSKIVAVCDSFDNQVSFIKYGSDISIHLTKKDLLSWKKDDFDSNVFIAFISSIYEFFKRGKIILLNNRSMGVVIKTNIRFPLNPIVQLNITQKRNGDQKPMVVDLIRTKDIWIEKIIK